MILACSAPAQGQFAIYCGTVFLNNFTSNTCPCTGHGGQYFIPGPTFTGIAAVAGACSVCNAYIIPGGYCNGTNPNETPEAKLILMAMPRHLLVDSCKGGLYPSQPLPALNRSEKPTMIGSEADRNSSPYPFLSARPENFSTTSSPADRGSSLRYGGSR